MLYIPPSILTILCTRTHLFHAEDHRYVELDHILYAVLQGNYRTATAGAGTLHL